MQLGSPLEALSAAIYQAALKDLPPVMYRRWTPTMRDAGISKEDAPLIERRPKPYECAVYAMFPQTWSSTALGFGGVGGQAFTPAYTVIIEGAESDFCVYFGGQFAYSVKCPNEQFGLDIASQRMAAVSAAGKYRSKSAVEAG